jgi:hypothetical protein
MFVKKVLCRQCKFYKIPYKMPYKIPYKMPYKIPYKMPYKPLEQKCKPNSEFSPLLFSCTVLIWTFCYKIIVA